MAMHIDYAPLGVYCHYTGDTGLHELLTAVETLAAHPEVDSFRFVVHDCSQANAIQLDEDALTLVSAQALGMAFSNTRLRSALVTTDTRIVAMLERYQALTGRQVAVHATLAQAEAWVQQALNG